MLNNTSNLTLDLHEQGKVTHITFDVDMYQAFLQPVLNNLAIVEKTKFRQEFEKGLTVEEARKDMIEHINNLYAGNH